MGIGVPLALRLPVEIRLAEQTRYLLTVFAAMIADADAIRPLPPDGSLH